MRAVERALQLGVASFEKELRIADSLLDTDLGEVRFLDAWAQAAMDVVLQAGAGDGSGAEINFAAGQQRSCDESARRPDRRGCPGSMGP